MIGRLLLSLSLSLSFPLSSWYLCRSHPIPSPLSFPFAPSHIGLQHYSPRSTARIDLTHSHDVRKHIRYPQHFNADLGFNKISVIVHYQPRVHLSVHPPTRLYLSLSFLYSRHSFRIVIGDCASRASDSEYPHCHVPGHTRIHHPARILRLWPSSPLGLPSTLHLPSTSLSDSRRAPTSPERTPVLAREEGTLRC